MTSCFRTRLSNLTGYLMSVALVVSMTGCTHWTPAPVDQWLKERSSPVPLENDFRPPSNSSTTQPDTAEVRLDRNPINEFADQQVQTVSHQEPYIARQFPNGNNYQPGLIPNGVQPAPGQLPTQPIQGQGPGALVPLPPGTTIQPGVPGVVPQTVVQGPGIVPGAPPVRATVPGVQSVQQTPPPVVYPNQGNTVFPRQNVAPRTSPFAAGSQLYNPGTGAAFPPVGTDPIYTPDTRYADLIVKGYPARTGRIMFGAAVNSDAGVTGQFTIDERNFDITRWPRSFQDLFNGNAFRGAGQTLRIEAVPGSDFDRYIVNFSNPNLFRYMPISMSLGGFLYDRRFNDWSEERLGGRVSFGYRLTPSLSVSAGFSGQNVEVTNPRALGVPELDAVLGDNELYQGIFTLLHDTRNSPIQPSDGHFFEARFEQAFGDFDYSRAEVEYRTYWKVAERADFSGKQTISYSTQLGFSGNDTPIFENFFAGGYATLRGFDFRGAGPVDPGTGIETGGRFQWLNSVEYMFPITADDAFRGVAFVDFGTVESDVKLDSDSFRVAPGLGLRIAIPLLGPAPLAFDWAYPVSQADTDERRLFSFYMSLVR